MKVFILFAMLFCHIVDDYYLQGWLANGKQRSWWITNAPDTLYTYDYLMALGMHSMSWAFMLLLPYAVFNGFEVGLAYVVLFVINTIIHMYVDDLKVNRHKINLITDQSIHLAQIIITYTLLFAH